MLHVAVLLKPYLDAVLDGRKTVECRLTIQPRVPYDAIEPGERIYFKQSAGPYRATARAEHIIFENDLTPKRVAQLQRDYNDLVCGEPRFWNAKRNSRFATFIWLKDVQPIATGPALRPLQGVAWVRLDEAPAWKTPKPSNDSFQTELTLGNLRNNSINVRKIVDCFPKHSIGGPTKLEAADPLTLILHDGPTIETDIVGCKGILRYRIWGTWFKKHGAKPGDRIVFTPIDETTYFVAIARGSG